MTTKTLSHDMVAGPIEVPLGKRIVTDKRDYYPFPRQKFPIDRDLLLRNGYGEAAVAILEKGHWISTSDIEQTGEGFSVIEFPDGARYATKLEFLGGERVSVEIVRRLLDAIR